MAADGGSELPQLPKRPTIIRPGKSKGEDEGIRVPARPAPPVPKATNTENDRSTTVERLKSRPLPPRPGERPIPPRPIGGVTQINDKPVPPPVKTGSVNKRPEITILSAKPMNEVGFRDAKPSVPKPGSSDVPSKHTENIDHVNGKVSTPAIKPPPQVPKAAPRGFQTDLSEAVEPGPLKPKGPPPPNPRPTVIKQEPPTGDLIQLDDVDNGSVPLRPTSVIGLKPLRPVSEPPSSVPSRKPPSTPLRPPTSPRKLDNNMQNTTNTNSLVDSLTPKLDHEEKNTSAQTGENTYSVINKPKRPTIIRPGKTDTSPVLKSGSSEKDTQVQSVKPSLNPSYHLGGMMSKRSIINQNFSGNN
ncbi:uncharacterized protein LOC128228392 [Mya arenaria]|uniref:uncharacterized protein LOC128228392 n=1 Tax=Mya arenaria TaxID=6604 RepID=UPI0022E14F98|nr:uncharacterized protein LOC128228392 [Mya arenaria]